MRGGKALAVALAAVPALAALAVVCLWWFVVAFPWENSAPFGDRDPGWYGVWFAGAGAAFVLALLMAVFLGLGRRRWAIRAFALQAAVAVALLVWGLSVSEHSDGTLLAVAAGCELAAVLSLAVSSADVQQQA